MKEGSGFMELGVNSEDEDLEPALSAKFEESKQVYALSTID